MIEVVLFDLGGVLVDFRSFETFLAWLGPDATEEVFWQRWLASPSVKAFELGHLDPELFIRRLITEMALPTSAEELRSWFEDWPRGFAPGAEALLDELRPDLRRACLSNSNPIHWAAFASAGLLGRFDAAFASHLLACLKPDAAVFRAVLSALACSAEAVVFLDDNQVNVNAARALGIQAERCRGVAEARLFLARCGLLNTEP